MPDEIYPAGLVRFPTWAFGKLHRAVHAELDTSLREHWILVCVEEYAELSQQQVATTLQIDRSEVVRLIDGLERAGLVTRTRDTVDRRKYRLTITEAGRAERRRMAERIDRATDKVLHRLDAEERHTLHRLANKAIGADPE
ncbi:MarR family transcriptional regulator [Nocardia panacis]|uniref:MarR family transcriptional regulator n=1 Tax=Nocardia panacis TaxID=2340916 RepID=A0A3A4KM35_9NOCA|nr:MarR family transcriptional regulator [Nocardia panacis]RJO78052.1 MarR family transcriptional regulator [Nocardia panacis]